VKARLSETDVKTVSTAVDEALHWIEEHHEAETEEFTERQKALEAKVMPILAKLGGAGGGGGGPSEMPSAPSGGAGRGPTIDEVD